MWIASNRKRFVIYATISELQCSWSLISVILRALISEKNSSALLSKTGQINRIKWTTPRVPMCLCVHAECAERSSSRKGKSEMRINSITGRSVICMRNRLRFMQAIRVRYTCATHYYAWISILRPQLIGLRHNCCFACVCVWANNDEMILEARRAT